MDFPAWSQESGHDRFQDDHGVEDEQDTGHGKQPPAFRLQHRSPKEGECRENRQIFLADRKQNQGADEECIGFPCLSQSGQRQKDERQMARVEIIRGLRKQVGWIQRESERQGECRPGLSSQRGIGQKTDEYRSQAERQVQDGKEDQGVRNKIE